jgi:hypothetical protein
LISSDAGLPPSGKAGKKKFLTDVEMKLRREETARKRKNLSEKKLEDEKVCFPAFLSPLTFCALSTRTD